MTSKAAALLCVASVLAVLVPGSRAAVAQPRIVTPPGVPKSGTRAVSPGEVQVNFSLCFAGGGYNCVVDGDTIWFRGAKVRIADIDAPETHAPRCASEKARGDHATRRLQQLLNSGAVTLEPIDRDRDRYGRLLRIVDVDGQSVGETLVAEGLARKYEGGRKPWC